MRTKSIIEIEKILKRKKETAEKEYKAIRNNMEKKYNTCWLDSVMTEEEKEILKNARENYNNLVEIIDDFEQHQW